MQLDWGELLKTYGPAVAGMANAAAQNRGETARNNLVRDNTAVDVARDANNYTIQSGNLGVNQAAEQRAEDEAAIRMALKGALLKNSTPFSFDTSQFKSHIPIGTPTGGASFGDDGKALGQTLYDRGTSTLSKPAAAPASSGAVARPTGAPGYQAPALSEPSKASFWENALGVAGLGMTALGNSGVLSNGSAKPAVMPGHGTTGSVAGDVAGVANRVAGMGHSTVPATGSVAGDVAGVADRVAGGGSGGFWSGANGAAGIGGMAAGVASSYLPAGPARGAAQGAAMGATIGSAVPGVGTAIGMGVGALVGAIASSGNETKGQREDLAKNLGYHSLADLNVALSKMGPAGEELLDAGLHKIGKHDAAGNKQWMTQVAHLLTGAR